MLDNLEVDVCVQVWPRVSVPPPCSQAPTGRGLFNILSWLRHQWDPRCKLEHPGIYLTLRRPEARPENGTVRVQI